MMNSSLLLGGPPVDDCVHCPFAVGEECKDNLRPLQISKYIALPALFSCALSCLGSIIIVFTYCRWKDIRTGSRKIITYLSIADFVTAFGYIIGSLNYYINYDNKNSCGNFNIVCKIQSFITTTSSLSSFVWSTALAIYLYVSVVHNESVRAQRFFPILHVLGWGAPLLITVPVLATGYLGYSTLAVSTWCYIQSCPNEKEYIPIFLSGKFWEILAYLLVFTFYILIKIHVKRQVAETKNPGVVSLLRKSDKKLIFIPVMFVFLRMWGTIHMFFTMGIVPRSDSYCISMTKYIIFTIFGTLQAVGDGGLGWGNLVLYILASDKIRKRLLSCHTDDLAEPILTEHSIEESTSDIKKYGGLVNSANFQVVLTNS